MDTSALPKGLNIQSLSNNMTVKENNHCATAEVYPDQQFKQNGGSQRMQLEQLCPDTSINLAANPTSNHLTLHESSSDMRSNSLHEYA